MIIFSLESCFAERVDILITDKVSIFSLPVLLRISEIQHFQ